MIYLYSELIDIDLLSNTNPPWIGPVYIQRKVVFPVRSKRERAWPKGQDETIFVIDEEALAKDLLNRGHHMGLIRLEGDYPTEQEREQSRQLAIAFMVDQIKGWQARWERAKSQGIGGATPSKQIIEYARILRTEVGLNLRDLDIPEGLLPLLGSFDVTDKGRAADQPPPLVTPEVEETEEVPSAEPVPLKRKRGRPPKISYVNPS